MVVLQQNFYWLKLLQDVSKYIRSCKSCTISKLSIKKEGMYTPLYTFGSPWESISMDYISGLPSNKQENDYVFVVVDQFSKMEILVICNKSITVEATANLFFKRVWVHFGYHKPSSHIEIAGSWAHSGWASSHGWTLRSQNSWPSTPKWMPKLRSSTWWSCISWACTIPSIDAHGMRVFPMFTIVTIDPYIAQWTTTPFRWG